MHRQQFSSSSLMDVVAMNFSHYSNMEPPKGGSLSVSDFALLTTAVQGTLLNNGIPYVTRDDVVRSYHALSNLLEQKVDLASMSEEEQRAAVLNADRQESREDWKLLERCNAYLELINHGLVSRNERGYFMSRDTVDTVIGRRYDSKTLKEAQIVAKYLFAHKKPKEMPVLH